MVYANVLNEMKQGHETRKELFGDLEEELGRPVVSFFTSFNFPVMIEDGDADMLEEVLREMDLSDGLALVINSAGGQGMAAERVIKVCREYSGTDEFWAIVPNQAKSAATMICFGSSKIIMGPTSELGPVDPQVPVQTPSGWRRFSAHHVIDSYEELFDEAVQTAGNLEPYIQQLDRYDEREVKQLRSACHLSRDISVKSLKSGMLSGKKADVIRSDIKVFLKPDEKYSHGRPIYRNEAASCGLEIEKADKDDNFWQTVYKLHVRSNNFVSSDQSHAKCVESAEHSYAAPARVQ